MSQERSPVHPPPEANDNEGTNLFITGLSLRVREKDLEDLFGKYGKVDKTQIMRDPHSDDSRGFGFINFTTSADATAALALDGFELMEKPLIVQRAKRSRARTPTPGSYRGPIKDRREMDRPRYGERERFDRYDRREYDRRSSFDRYDPRYERPRYERGGYDRYESRYERGPSPREGPREFEFDRERFERRPPQYEDRSETRRY